MERYTALVRELVGRRSFTLSEPLRAELVRKALHLLIALVPLMAAVDLGATVALLGSGTLFYVFAEKLRLQGHQVFLVTDLTVIASRDRDHGRLVLGPVTLGVGAMLCLLLYPSTAAAVAIYALAFGDGFASLAGKLVGGPVLPLTRTKTLAGSLACFLAVFLAAWRLSGNLTAALAIGVGATALELLPVRDFDNLILPVGTGLLATRLLLP
jgi:phytol kinase